MTKREKQLYHFGVVCGLVKGIAKQLMKNMESPAAKRALWHRSRMGEDCPTDLQTAEEKAALLRGYAHGEQLQKELYL